MTSVFVGGSRNISKLNDALRTRIDNIIREQYLILIGDANGADKIVQNYLHTTHYDRVVVFCTGDECRNNLGGWEIERVKSDDHRKNFSYYSRKDFAMAERADYGFMIWNGKSTGTLQNMLNLMKGHKPTLVYYSPRKQFFDVMAVQDLESLLTQSDKKTLALFEAKLKLSKRLAELKRSSIAIQQLQLYAGQ